VHCRINFVLDQTEDFQRHAGDHASAKLPARGDPASTPGSNSKLPFPRLIIARPAIAEVAACTSVNDANCPLLNSITSCTGLNPPIANQPQNW
jgi:hypothetical protein